MNLDRKNYKEGIRKGTTDFFEALRQYYKSEHCRFRTSYDRTISQAINVFGEERFHVAVFETMFEPANIDRLSRFCGVAPRPDFASVMVNKARSKVDADLAVER